MITLSIEDEFVRRVIRCFGGKRFTKEELEEVYDRVYPLPKISISKHNLGRIFRRSYSYNHTSVNVEQVLRFLCDGGYVKHELTYFTDRPIKDGVTIYFLTEKGNSILKKKK